MHVDRDTLEKMLSGDLGLEEQITAEYHLESCATCRGRLEENELFQLLVLVDDPAPAVDPGDIIARAERRRPAGFGRWAAGVLLTFGAAGAVYAAPGSPVPRWFEALSGDFGDRASQVPEYRTAPPDVAGIVVPFDERLEIELRPQPSGTISIVLVEASEVTVEAVNGPATFDSRAEQLIVEAGTTTDYRITIPRDAQRIEVFVGGTAVFRLEAGQIETTARQDASGRYSVAFSDVR